MKHVDGRDGSHVFRTDPAAFVHIRKDEYGNVITIMAGDDHVLN